MMLNGLFGLGRAYKKLPAHHNFDELARNIETLSNFLLDASLGDFGSEGYKRAPSRWQWQLGKDLQMLVQYARDYVPPDADGLHSPGFFRGEE